MLHMTAMDSMVTSNPKHRFGEKDKQIVETRAKIREDFIKICQLSAKLKTFL